MENRIPGKQMRVYLHKYVEVFEYHSSLLLIDDRLFFDLVDDIWRNTVNMFFYNISWTRLVKAARQSLLFMPWKNLIVESVMCVHLSITFCNLPIMIVLLLNNTQVTRVM